MRPDDAPGERGDRRDEQDPAETASGHGGQKALRQQERRPQVDGDGLVEVLDGNALQRLALPAGVVHQHVYRPERVLGLLGQPDDLRRVGQVGAERGRPSARRGDLPGQLMGRSVARAIADRNARTRRRQG